MRPLLLNLIAIVLAAAGGYGLCAALGWDPHFNEMLLAGVGTLIASELATLPAMLWKARDAGAASQAGLVGTVVHLMLGIGFAGAVMITRKPHIAFAYWVMLFYWVTLVTVVVSMVKGVQAASRPASPDPTPVS
jgi:hypothetical protein